MFSHLKPKLLNSSLQDIKKKKKPLSGARSAQHSGVKWTVHSRNYPPWTAWCRLWSWESNLFLNTSWTFFLASKFAANSGVQGISESFLFLDFPLAHHSFFPLSCQGSGIPGCAHAGMGWGSEVLWDFWTGLKASNFDPKFLPACYPCHPYLCTALTCSRMRNRWEWISNLSSFCSCSFTPPPWSTQSHFLTAA